MKTVDERFWDKVDIKDITECWPWKGTHNKGGYGLFWPERRTTKGAHVYAFEYDKEPVIYPDEVHHTCNNAGCVNPLHLEIRTRKENIREKDNHTKTHCVNGHERTANNLYYKRNGTTDCLVCRRIRDRK